MPQDEIMPVSDCSFPDGVDIGGSGRQHQWFNDSVPWTAGGSVFLDPSDLSDPQHCQAFHAPITLDPGLITVLL